MSVFGVVIDGFQGLRDDPWFVRTAKVASGMRSEKRTQRKCIGAIRDGGVSGGTSVIIMIQTYGL